MSPKKGVYPVSSSLKKGGLHAESKPTRIPFLWASGAHFPKSGGQWRDELESFPAIIWHPRGVRLVILPGTLIAENIPLNHVNTNWSLFHTKNFSYMTQYGHAWQNLTVLRCAMWTVLSWGQWREIIQLRVEAVLRSAASKKKRAPVAFTCCFQLFGESFSWIFCLHKGLIFHKPTQLMAQKCKAIFLVHFKSFQVCKSTYFGCGKVQGGGCDFYLGWNLEAMQSETALRSRTCWTRSVASSLVTNHNERKDWG